MGNNSEEFYIFHCFLFTLREREREGVFKKPAGGSKQRQRGWVTRRPAPRRPTRPRHYGDFYYQFITFKFIVTRHC